jgi:hypothetical protein
VSDTWASTRASINRLKTGWQDADEDTKLDIGFWAAGLAMMAAAIVAQFGWIGALFCAGLVIWFAGNHALRHGDQ